MPPSRKKSQPSGFAISDILYVLYRHKVKIILLSLLTLGVAGFLYQNRKPIYQSDSELLVRYLSQYSAVDSFEQESGVGGRYAEYALGPEIKILESSDLAHAVVEKHGAKIVLPGQVGEIDPNAAASVIDQGITVGFQKGSGILQVSFQHPNQEVTSRVLDAVLSEYFKRHLEVHRSTDAYDFISKQAKEATERLTQTQKDLNELKMQLGVLDLEKSVAHYDAQKSRLEQEIGASEAQVAKQRARVNLLESLKEEGEGSAAESEKKASVSKLAENPGQLPAEAARIFNALGQRLNALEAKRSELLQTFAESSAVVQNTNRNIADTRSKRNILGAQFPVLVSNRAVASTTSYGSPIMLEALPSYDLEIEQVNLAADEAGLATLQEQMFLSKANISRFAMKRSEIEALEIKREAEAAKVAHLQKVLEKSTILESLDPSNIPNIDVIQKPTPGYQVVDAKTKKILLGIASSGLLAGLGIAFLIEFFFDRRVKRAGEIENRLQVPLLMSIPLMKNRQLPQPQSQSSLQPRLQSQQSLAAKEQRPFPPQEVFQPDTQPVYEHFVNPYATAIRDRLFYQFEMRGVKHKPKMIAVTSQTDGAGASTIASGLAAAFQGGGEARVLLIDMTNGIEDGLRVFEEEVVAQRPAGPHLPILGEKSTQRISLKAALEDTTNARSEETLYVAPGRLEDRQSVDRKLAPRKLFELMPSFRKSEFDYIIFDMPKLDELSPTVAMAAIMDEVLLVLDAQKTDRDDLKKNFSDLSKGNAHVSTIFNKTKSSGPRWLGN